MDLARRGPGTAQLPLEIECKEDQDRDRHMRSDDASHKPNGTQRKAMGGSRKSPWG